MSFINKFMDYKMESLFIPQYSNQETFLFFNFRPDAENSKMKKDLSFSLRERPLESIFNCMFLPQDMTE